MVLQLLTITALLERPGKCHAPVSDYLSATEAHTPPGQDSWPPRLSELYLPLLLVSDVSCPVSFPFALGGKEPVFSCSPELGK